MSPFASSLRNRPVNNRLMSYITGSRSAIGQGRRVLALHDALRVEGTLLGANGSPLNARNLIYRRSPTTQPQVVTVPQFKREFIAANSADYGDEIFSSVARMNHARFYLDNLTWDSAVDFADWQWYFCFYRGRYTTAIDGSRAIGSLWLSSAVDNMNPAGLRAGFNVWDSTEGDEIKTGAPAGVHIAYATTNLQTNSFYARYGTYSGTPKPSAYFPMFYWIQVRDTGSSGTTEGWYMGDDLIIRTLSGIGAGSAGSVSTPISTPVLHVKAERQIVSTWDMRGTSGLASHLAVSGIGTGRMTQEQVRRLAVACYGGVRL